MSMAGARRSSNGAAEPLFQDDSPEPKTGSCRSPAYDAMKREVEARFARRRAKPKTIAAAKFDRSRSEVLAMIETGEWESVGASHLVALYDVMHEEIYGVKCAELGPEARYNAMMMAAQLTKREFGGDYEKAVEFMRWAWNREARDEKWRVENGRSNARRIGARLMFGGALVTDYKVYLHRVRK